jgi:hypothetical protein
MILEQDTAVVGHRPAPLRLMQVFDAARANADNKPERLITYNRGMQQYHAYSGEVTLVLSRSIQRSAEIAGTLALFMAQKYPDRNVVLFNTYASADLMTAGFARALYYLGMKAPTSFQRYLPKVTKDNFDDSVDLPSPENLRIIDCPSSMLTPESLELEIVRNSASGGRGALGMLSAYSKSIWHIVEEWEHRSWVKKLMEVEMNELM